MKYKMKVVVKSSCYIGLDHTSTQIQFEVCTRDKLPQYKVHEEDKMLDMEPTLFDAMAGHWPDEEDDDFGSDDDNDDFDGKESSNAGNKPVDGDVDDDFGDDFEDD